MYALKFAAAALVASTAFAGAAVARDQVKVVGSSTVFPYSQAAAEEYANKTGNPAPVVESTGTGGGFKVFCGGIGPDFADITGASRAIKDSEAELCASNGVTDISEALIGYDGLSIAHARSAPEMDLTEEQIFKALAAELPDGNGGFVANPNKKLRCLILTSLLSVLPRHQALVTLSLNSSCTTVVRNFLAWQI